MTTIANLKFNTAYKRIFTGALFFLILLTANSCQATFIRPSKTLGRLAQRSLWIPYASRRFCTSGSFQSEHALSFLKNRIKYHEEQEDYDSAIVLYQEMIRLKEYMSASALAQVYKSLAQAYQARNKEGDFDKIVA